MSFGDTDDGYGLMADHGVVCSMSRSGNVWDNAAMESFFSSLKTERSVRKRYRTARGAHGCRLYAGLPATAVNYLQYGWTHTVLTLRYRCGEKQ
jgi:transposase InsO family protein